MNWQEVKTELKMVGGGLKCQLPIQFSFAKHSSCTRLYYLGHFNQPSNTLLCKDVQSGLSDSPPRACLSKFLPLDASKNLSKEQELLRERMRIKGTGISSYSISEHRTHPDDFVQIIFTLGSQLNVYRDNGTSDNAIILPCTGTLLNPTTCPYDSSLVASVQDKDIHVHLIPDPSSLSSLENPPYQAQLTHLSNAFPKKSAGMPTYIAQEEFDRYTGFWWKPSADETTEGHRRQYQLLFEEVDEDGVQEVHLPSYQQSGLSSDTFRYPRAGTTNATSELKLLDFYRDDMKIEGVTELSLEQPLHILFPDMEYLVQAGWMPDSSMVYAVMMNRSQTLRKVFLIPVENFKTHHNNDSGVSGKYYEILTESSDSHWINNHHLLHFLSSSNNSCVKVIFGTEVSNHLHLHHATYDLTSCISDNNVLKASKVDEKILTAGDWDVDGSKLWVQEDKALVYFVAYKETPLETHLYVSCYDNDATHDPHKPTFLTLPSFNHSVSMDKDCEFFLSSYSSLEAPDRCDVFSIQSASPSSVTSSIVSNVYKHEATGYGKPPKPFSFVNSSGTRLYGMFIEPDDVERGKTGCLQAGEETRSAATGPQDLSEDQPSTDQPSKDNFSSSSERFVKEGKYPVVVLVYGGPGVQLVNNSFSHYRRPLQHKLSRFGMGVLLVDNRGAYHRGQDFEHPIRHSMGRVEVQDQVEAVLHAQQTFPSIDLTRIGIMGWSYGGYMSLMCLAQRPDIFKVAISGAPVTSWNLYDTAYTERYMGMPAQQADAYKQSSVLPLAPNFPDQANRLLIVHGLMDENVHFFHTSSLVEALNHHCKPFVLQTYPKERHGIRNLESYNHYETTVLHFLTNHLC